MLDPTMLNFNEKEALKICLKLAEKNKTPVKPVQVVEQKGELTFFFLAPAKTDFRNLARDLNRHFKMRIGLQQIAGRKAATFFPGCGRCGRPLCCRTWLKKPPQVPLPTIQKQLKLNGPADNLTGACGKLLCCLVYETRETKKSSLLPKEGGAGGTPSEAAPPEEEKPSEERRKDGRKKKKTKGRRLVRRLVKAQKSKSKSKG